LTLEAFNKKTSMSIICTEHMKNKKLKNSIKSLDLSQIGVEMYQLVSDLYPICRSITGNGVRETLKHIKKEISLKIHEVPSGTTVFDWVVPKEWNIRDAYVKDSAGNKVIDFKKSNLHILNYSIPVQKKVSLQELQKHLFTIPEYPEWIPYRTSYYNANWGFCLSHNDFVKLKEDDYEVYIDSNLRNGHLTFGEYFIQGQLSDEILISTHICHPSLCNDNLSGIAMTAFLAKHLSEVRLRYSYRFLFIPGTIGSITWLSLNEQKLANIKHGLVLACVGDSGKFTYKKTRQENKEIDIVVMNTLKNSEKEFSIIDFSPYGYDERQYCSPGINLPVGCLMRTPHGEYPEYHTSADNLGFVSAKNLTESFETITTIINTLEENKRYINQNPKCEPQLGRRGLYQHIGGHPDSKNFQLTMLWVLNLSDGHHSLVDISERSGLKFDLISEAAEILVAENLLKEAIKESNYHAVS
jgi:aminopeptidase-like protein